MSDRQQPAALYVWLVRSEEVLEQPGSWRIRKWDIEPFKEANYALTPLPTATARDGSTSGSPGQGRP